jgi:hypothetical protein
MALNPALTELTTAATDALIALVSLVCMAALLRHRTEHRWRVTVWSWVFALLAFASVLGALAHGLDLAPPTRASLWRPLYLSLCLVVALFVVGAVADFRGETAARLALIPMLCLALGFFVVTQFVTGSFLIFVVYEGLAMLSALGMYLSLTLKRQLAGAGTIAAGILLNIAAAAIQSVDAIAVTIVVPFDHNGVFHLVQVAALIVLTAGLLRSMRPQLATHARV